MTGRPILDAGPALTFFATNSERLLLSVLGQISVPQAVAVEIVRKSNRDARLAPAAPVWNRLVRSPYVQVLSDDVTPELSAAVERVGQLPLQDRLLQSKDLGEIMVVSHAAVQADAGMDVIVLIDDGEGARLAQAESLRLQRLRKSDHGSGSIQLVGTHTVLARAAGTLHLKDKSAMRKLYERMRTCDDGLVDIAKTDLLSNNVWTAPTA